MAAVVAALEVMQQRSMRRQKVFRDRTMQLDTLNDDELFARYRMTRISILFLLERVRPIIQHPTKRSRALSPETQLMLTLRFLSKGGFLMEMGDLHGLHQSSVSRSFHRTVRALNLVLDNIKFPSPNSHASLMLDFYKIAEMPRVLGAIDGTLVPIKRPNGDDESAYVCRKGYHAINVQAVCDANLRFINVVAKWPGSSHDSMILNNSELGENFEQTPPEGWLLGDSGYACRPWLRTPVLHAVTRPEQKYNSAHCRTRNTIERAFGVLKSRFRCLHRSAGCLQFQPTRCVNIIMACFHLHNFWLTNNIPEPQEILEGEAQDNNLFGHQLQDGHAARTMHVPEQGLLKQVLLKSNCV